MTYNTEEFRKAQAAVAAAQQKANEDIAQRIASIKELLREVNQIATEAGVELDLQDLVYTINDIDTTSGAWYHSSC